jgi:hypothetical protein
MKIDRLETHDRLVHLSKQTFDIGKNCQNLIDQRPFGNHSFYIFAHKRQIALDERLGIYNEDLRNSIVDISYIRQYMSMETVPTDRIIWQPRLTKPKAQTNSMLFKGYPGTDNVKVIWIIPDRCLWEQFEKGKMTESRTIWESIQAFTNHPERLEAKEDDDYSDEAIDKIYKEIARGENGMDIA